MIEVVPDWGSLGPWIAAAALIIITALFLWWRWNGRAWMKIDLFGDATKDRKENLEGRLREPDLVATTGPGAT